MSKSIGVKSILTCKENFIINLFENIICRAMTLLYYKRNRKTHLVRLWCDNASSNIGTDRAGFLRLCEAVHEAVRGCAYLLRLCESVHTY